MSRNIQAISGRNLFRLTCLLIAFVLSCSVQGLFPVSVLAADQPDLVIQEITFSPEEPEVGETVTVTVNVRNQGTAQASPSYVVCYVDADIIATKSVSSLGPGMMTTVNFQWTAEVGTHTIKCIADSSESISESDETNNTSTYTLTPLAADLVIESITWTPASCSPGDQVTFQVKIKNIGNTHSDMTTVDLRIDTVSRGLHDIPRIYPGETHTDSYTWIALNGQHSIKAIADESHRVPESNENNNQLQITFSTQAPDLVIEDILLDPEIPSKDDEATITVTVTNQGSGRANSCHMGYSIDTISMVPLAIPELTSGSSANITIEWTVLSGTHTFDFSLDVNDRLSEIDEENNEDSLEITAMVPDLTIQDITWTPEDAAAGDDVTFSITVLNLGAGRSDSTQAAMYIDGKFQGYISFGPLDQDETATGTIQWEAPYGSHKISVTIDHAGLLKETNESNNKLIETINVLPPELEITSITWEPENPNAGESVTFNVTVNNTGPGRAENFHLAYYLDDELVTSVPVIALESGGSAAKTYKWTSQKGRHKFKAVADFNNYVFEENENNNFYEVTVVPNMPDLVVHAVRWDQASVTPGENTVFNIDIKNTGTQITLPSRVSYFVDGVDMGYTDIGPVQPDEIVTEKFIWPVTGVDHEIRIVADFTGLVEEIDETNNTRIVTLPTPDIIVDDISWAPVDASVGDTVTFTITLRNNGGSETQPSTATCSVDGDSPVTIDFPAIAVGTTCDRTFNWIAVKGSHDLAVTADVNNTTTETNETNNTKTIEFSTLTPDLRAGNISWKMENPLVRNEVIFSIEVVNDGSDAAGVSSITYSFDDGLPVARELPVIPAGETITVEFTTMLESGPHDLVIVIDADEVVTELDETNNESTYSLNTSAADLIVRSITWSPDDAGAGDNVTITAAIENRGKSTAENVVAQITIDDILLGEITFDSIGVGEKLTGDITWMIEPGLHEISVFADYGGTIIESDETNNSFSRTISLGGPPATGEPDETGLPVTHDVPEKGLLADSWMLIILVAIVLGGSSFYLLFRSFKKD